MSDVQETPGQGVRGQAMTTEEKLDLALSALRENHADAIRPEKGVPYRLPSIRDRCAAAIAESFALDAGCSMPLKVALALAMAPSRVAAAPSTAD